MNPDELYSKIKKDLEEVGDPQIRNSLEAKINSLYQSYKTEREMAKQDGLTQLPNFRALIEFLEKQTAHARRYGEPLALGFVDFNDLKQYNDTYGHVQANYAIQIIAQEMKRSLRAQDFLARYGGDEFCIVFPNTNLEGSNEVVNRVKKNLDALVIDAKIDYLPNENYRKVTVSTGITALREKEGYRDMLNRANKAMKEAKTTSKQTSSIVYIE